MSKYFCKFTFRVKTYNTASDLVSPEKKKDKKKKSKDGESKKKRKSEDAESSKKKKTKESKEGGES